MGMMRCGKKVLLSMFGAVVVILSAGCATLPTSSTPVTVGTLSHQPTDQAVPPPPPGADPDQLLHDFLDVSNVPIDRHSAARQYLTREAQAKWDDGAGVTVVDNTAVLRESQDDRQATYVVRATKVGQLLDAGVFQPDAGSFQATIGLVRTGSEWRINQLPPGVILGRNLFTDSYQPDQLFFPNPSGTALVPDIRWLPSSHNNPAQTLLNMMVEAPRPALGPAVRNELAAGVSVNQVTRADGKPGPIGVGLGGARIDFHGADSLDQHSREMLAAQTIWTLDNNGVLGPYVLLSDGKPLDDRYGNGWNTTDVAAFNPTVMPGAGVDLHAVVDGRLVSVANTGPTLVAGAFGSAINLRTATLSYDGRQVAGVAAAEGPGPRMQLLLGTLGAGATGVVRGDQITRPTWFPGDGSVWAVVDGTRVVRATRTGAGVTVTDVDAAPVLARGRQITELRLSRDGVRAAMVVDGRLCVAIVVAGPGGRYTLTDPQFLPIGIGARALSVAWDSGSRLLVAEDSDAPLVTVMVDGTSLRQFDTIANITPPVMSVQSVPQVDYIKDARTILYLRTDDPDLTGRFWREVPNLTSSAADPVLPG